MQVILNSMHKYRPRIHVIPAKDYNMFSMKKGSFYTFVFPETEFMAVTAYQNPRVSHCQHKMSSSVYLYYLCFHS